MTDQEIRDTLEEFWWKLFDLQRYIDMRDNVHDELIDVRVGILKIKNKIGTRGIDKRQF